MTFCSCRQYAPDKPPSKSESRRLREDPCRFPTRGSPSTPYLHHSPRSRSCHITDEDCEASWFSQEHSQRAAELGPKPRAGAALTVFTELLLRSKQPDQHLENKGGKGAPPHPPHPRHPGSLHLLRVISGTGCFLKGVSFCSACRNQAPTPGGLNNRN